MTISNEAAVTLAQIIPVGLLIVGIEIRIVPRLVATGRAGTVMLWILGAGLVSALSLGFLAEYLLVRAIIEGTSLSTFSTVVANVGLGLLGWASFLLLFASLGEVLGLTDRIGRRARDKTASSPRRLSRQMRYIEDHHPRVFEDR